MTFRSIFKQPLCGSCDGAGYGFRTIAQFALLSLRSVFVVLSFRFVFVVPSLRSTRSLNNHFAAAVTGRATASGQSHSLLALSLSLSLSLFFPPSVVPLNGVPFDL